MTGPAPEYVAARRVLLNALGALEGHIENLVLVGAQAVYHRTGEGELGAPPFTTDSDLAIDAAGLDPVPEIGGALKAAGFSPGADPGHWIGQGEVAVDLMVVPHQAGTTKKSARAARLDPHDAKTARIARGLEPALVDHHVATLAALEPGDSRSIQLNVAGPAALLTAKAIKIGERLVQSGRQPDRLKEKDALDAFRIFQAVETDVLVAGFTSHGAEDHAAAASTEAIEIYRQHALTADGQFARLATSAAGGDPTIAPALAALVSDLLAAL